MTEVSISLVWSNGCVSGGEIRGYRSCSGKFQTTELKGGVCA